MASIQSATDKMNEMSNEEMNNLLLENSFSDASFSINHDYGKEYSECVKRLNPLVEEKYFNVFSNCKKEKITNIISPYSRETITWATVYSRVIRKIINPFRLAKGQLLLSLEELDRHIAVVLQNRDLFKNNDTSSSEPIKGRIEINDRLQKESENYIPKLISKFSFLRPDFFKDEELTKRGKKRDSVKMKKRVSIKEEPFRKKSAIELKTFNKLKTVNALNRLSVAYENHNSQKNMLHERKKSEASIKISDISKAIDLLIFSKPGEKSGFSTLSQQMTEVQNNNKKTQMAFRPSRLLASTSGITKFRNKSITTSNFAISAVKSKVKRRVTIVEDIFPSSVDKKYNEFRQIPLEDNYFSVNHYKPVEKMAYRDELERYNPNKKISNYGFYVTRENENIFKEMFDLINFQPITLDSNKFTPAELQKRGEKIASYKSMSNDLILSILKVDHIK